MKRFSLLFCLLVLLCLGATAENYPYRGDVLWVTVPNHTDWLYETGEKATVDIQLYQYGIPQDGVVVSYELGNDLMPADAQGEVVLKKGRATIVMGTMKEPGFRDCRMTVKLGDQTYKHHIKVGFSVDKIRPYTQMPADFEAFWQKNKEELAAFPLTYSKELVEEYCTEKTDCYLVKVPINKRGQAVYGYLTYPKNAQKGSCPVVLCPPGAGIKTIKEPMRRKNYAERGCIRLEIEIHGLNPTMTPEEFKEISTAFGHESNYLNINLENRDNYYMKRVYLACVRCIDLLTSLPEWDGKNVIVQGGSQGGGLALVTAGLDERVTHCVANHPALSDMAGFEAGRADGYPHFSRTPGMTTPEKVQTMAYYDVVNFARLVKAQTYLTWGFNDDVCAPTTSYAAYNVLTCPKEALVTPINEHWTSEVTNNGQLEWILRHLK